MLYVYEQIRIILSESSEFKNLEHELVIFGSVENGLYDKHNSDLDLTIIL